ncbi:MFS transporter [Spongiactinospora sp. TRM90649]|uniref:MFS transporter n=1 Tax=Spongiactinospora sp. TRM90649 TaxID=3031114 RepID=UPI0023F8786B|nr:MFS transporter [Spongiactinospora sp. TRM90649]MDF5756711.1 MFS transporter [Spongiactinospora sp. TRM90649]
MTGTLPHTPGRQARNARLAVCYFFVLLGVVTGVWAARIPAVKETVGLSDGQLSYGLLAIAAGLVIGMRFAGRLTDRLGSARLMTPAAVLTALAVIAPGYATTLPVLIASLFCFGLVNASLDVSMNAHGVQVERAYGRPLMSSFHGMFSVGGLLGAGIGAAFAWAGVAAGPTFAATAIPLAALCLLARRGLLPSTPAPAENRARPRRRVSWTARIALLGAVAFAGLVGEGAANDWTAVYLHDHLAAAPGLAAVGFAVFSTAMTIGRLAGDGLAARLGPVRLVRWSGVTAAAGLGAALALPSVPLSIAGFAVFGLGLSTIVPLVFSAAGNDDPERAGEAIAQVAMLGYSGLVLGPAIIGGAAELAGLRIALTIPLALAVFMAASAPALRGRRSPSE